MPGFFENGTCPHLDRKLQKRLAHRLRSLNELPRGCKARVADITGDSRQRQRLCSLGITPGTEVEVCGDFPGQCRLLVRGSCLALDCDVAKQVLCENEGV